MKNVLKYLLLALIAVSQLFACGGSDDEKTPADNFDVQFTVPGSVDVTEGGECTFAVSGGGKSPLTTDTFILESDAGISYVCPIVNTSSDSFTVRLADGCKTGYYKIFVKRDARKKSFGRIYINIVDKIDFVTYDIPVHGNYDTRQKLMMDASTSRLFMKAITNTRALGRVVVFMDADFRGGAEGSYTPRLRSAYVSFLGFTLGRDVTTFCDLSAAPTTIDFQGPNAYNFNFATMVRYEYAFADNHLKFGVAAEMPSVSGTYNDNFATLKQRVPDFPAYFQYAWGANRDSHIRASGVVRNMYLHNLRTGNNTSLLGWGVQFSGTIKVAQPLRLFMNGVYGKGVTPYIQDLTGSGLDFTPNPENADQIQTMPMWGWQAAAQINLTPRLFISGGYSTVRVQRSHGFYSDDQYKQGQYIFGNIFYSITPRCKVAGEYLYGSRKDMSNDKGHANRVNVMLQYSF